MVPKNRKASPMSTPSDYKPFKFNSLKNGMPNDKVGLHQLAFYAHMQFLKDGGVVTVCRPGVAVGASFTTNKHPRNSIVGAQSPLTV